MCLLDAVKIFHTLKTRAKIHRVKKPRVKSVESKPKVIKIRRVKNLGLNPSSQCLGLNFQTLTKE